MCENIHDLLELVEVSSYEELVDWAGIELEVYSNALSFGLEAIHFPFTVGELEGWLRRCIM